MNVEEFRQKNPQYEDMSNADLGFGLWNKHYKDDMNAWEFANSSKVWFSTAITSNVTTIEPYSYKRTFS